MVDDQQYSNPFAQAQADAAYDPSQPDLSGEAAPLPAPGGSMVPGGAPPGVQVPKFFEGSPTELGKLRDSLMDLMPGVNQVADDTQLSLTGTQKMGLLAMSLSNPTGALDLVREMQQRQQKRKELAARTNLMMLDTARGILDAQNNVKEKMFHAQLAALKSQREQQELDADIEYKNAMANYYLAKGGAEQAQASAFSNAWGGGFGGFGGFGGQPAPDTMGGYGGPTGSLIPGESAILDENTPNPLTGELGGQTLTPEATADIFAEAEPMPGPSAGPPGFGGPSMGSPFPPKRTLRRSLTTRGPSITETVEPGFSPEDVVRELMKQPLFLQADPATQQEMFQNAMKFLKDPAALAGALGAPAANAAPGGMIPPRDDLGL